jgi:hypothetical protein
MSAPTTRRPRVPVDDRSQRDALVKGSRERELEVIYWRLVVVGIAAIAVILAVYWVLAGVA